ncbi:hypothetical protein Tco_0997079 [Tanacetum coccineum]
MPSIQENQTLHLQVQDQLQRELEAQIYMSKAFRAKAKAEREIRGDHILQLMTSNKVTFIASFIPSNTPYYSRPIRRIQDFAESKDHCMTLKNTPYPPQRYAVYNTLVNIEEPIGLTSIRHIHQEDTVYPCLHFTDNHDGLKTQYTVSRSLYTSYPRFIKVEDSRRYQTWSLLQEIPNTSYPTSPDTAYRPISRLYE